MRGMRKKIYLWHQFEINWIASLFFFLNEFNQLHIGTRIQVSYSAKYVFLWFEHEHSFNNLASNKQGSYDCVPLFLPSHLQAGLTQVYLAIWRTAKSYQNLRNGWFALGGSYTLTCCMHPSDWFSRRIGNCQWKKWRTVSRSVCTFPQRAFVHFVCN